MPKMPTSANIGAAIILRNLKF